MFKYFLTQAQQSRCMLLLLQIGHSADNTFLEPSNLSSLLVIKHSQNHVTSIKESQCWQWPSWSLNSNDRLISTVAVFPQEKQVCTHVRDLKWFQKYVPNHYILYYISGGRLTAFFIPFSMVCLNWELWGVKWGTELQPWWSLSAKSQYSCCLCALRCSVLFFVLFCLTWFRDLKHQGSFTSSRFNPLVTEKRECDYSWLSSVVFHTKRSNFLWWGILKNPVYFGNAILGKNRTIFSVFLFFLKSQSIGNCY